MKFQALHCFRGIACLCILLYHSDFVLGTWFNPLNADHSVFFVDFFFMLSGFVISFSYGEKILRKSIAFKQFLLLRLVGRLYPLHIFTLALYVPYILVKVWIYNNYGIGTDPRLLHTVFSFLANVFMIHGLIENVPSCAWNGPSWTLSVELFLYIIFFFLISWLGRATSSKKGCFFFLISILAYFMCFNGYSTEYILTYVMLRGIGGFFAGAAIFELYKNSKIGLSNLNFFAASFLECAVMAMSVYFVVYKSALAAIYFLMPVVYVFAVQENGIISKFVKNRFLVKAGDLSFSIYLNQFLVLSVFHNLFIYVFKFPVVMHEGRKLVPTDWAILINLFLVVLVVSLSFLTYNYVEMPCRKKVREMAYNQR